MAGFDNAYSRFIAAAKIILPLAALALLSTLFLFSRRLDVGQTIPYSDIDVERLAREQRITAPQYAAVTADGTAISVSATEARPEPGMPEQGSASGIVARLDFADGGRADIASAAGRIDTAAGIAELTGGVTMKTSDGLTMTTERLKTALDSAFVTSDTPVHMTGPMGDLTAGAMELTRADQDGNYVLVFKDRVKLIYQPEN